jgi:hypothetical protein
MIFEHFRIKTPTLAVFEIDGQRSLTYISSGDMVIVVDGSPDALGLIKVKCDDQTALVFASDLCERGELVRAAAA